jgi:hypothetical protein
VFGDCFQMTAITVSSGNSSYSSMNGVLFNESQTTLIQCPGGLVESYIVPDSVTSIGDYAFFGCSSLNSITISNGVTSIGDSAFQYCGNLTSVTIPNSVTSIGESAFQYCGSLTSVTIPSSVTTIGEYVFYYCPSLANVTIPNGVTSIGDYAFGSCVSLTSVTIPSSVTNIGDYAFSSCYNLTSVMIPDRVTDIGAGAFESCVSLTSVTIPSSVTNIGDYAFAYCGLTSIYFVGNAPTADSTVFSSDPSTVYYLPGTTGWSSFDAGLGAVLWNPLIKTGDPGFGAHNNQFEFNITGTSNLVVVVEASTNLANPVWTPLQTATLTNGLFNFSDSQRTNYHARFYGLGFP